MDTAMGHVTMDYSQITDEIFVGTNACCATHFDELLIKRGVIADISLESEKIDAPWGIKYFLWLPTIDETAPTLEALAFGVQMITFLAQKRMKVYVHCKNGHGRAPTLVAAYFIAQGMSVDDAIKRVRKARNEIHIQPVQEATLKLFQQKLTW